MFIKAYKRVKVSADQIQATFESEDMNAIIYTILRKADAQNLNSERKDIIFAKLQDVIDLVLNLYFAPDGTKLPQTGIDTALKATEERIGAEQTAEHHAELLSPKLVDVMSPKRVKSDMRTNNTISVAMSGGAASVVRNGLNVQRKLKGSR